MSFRYYPSIFNEINNKIRQSTSYVDCKLMFFDGSLVVNFAKLVAAGFWWTRFNNFLKKICNLVAFHLKPRGCLVINNKICEQRQYAIGSCTKNAQGGIFHIYNSPENLAWIGSSLKIWFLTPVSKIRL